MVWCVLCSFCVISRKCTKKRRFLDSLRQLEIDMNSAFDQYRQLYYDGGIASVYLWETTDDVESFAGSVLFKKAGLGSQMIKGCWDSIHVFEVIIYRLELCSSNFLKITYSLEWVLMELVELICSLEFELAPISICSIRTRFRDRVIFEKSLQLMSLCYHFF